MYKHESKAYMKARHRNKLDSTLIFRKLFTNETQNIMINSITEMKTKYESKESNKNQKLRCTPVNKKGIIVFCDYFKCTTT